MFNLARNWRLEMLRRSIQITVLKDTERLTDLREGVHREREREGAGANFRQTVSFVFRLPPGRERHAERALLARCSLRTLLTKSL